MWGPERPWIRPVVLLFSPIKGKKIALLGYSLTQPLEFFATDTQGGTAPGWKKFVHDDISRIRPQVDYVMVSFHWGKEASGRVQPYQQQAAHTAIDAGADAVIGHHPHVLQGVERYKQGIIFYSLGNFAFASKSTTAETSALIRFRLDGQRKSAEIIPLDVLYRRVKFQPRRVSGGQATQVIDTLNRLSQPFVTSITQQLDGRYLIPF